MKEEEERLRNIKCWMRLQECGKVTVIPAALGPLGTITTGFEKYVTAIEINVKIEQIEPY